MHACMHVCMEVCTAATYYARVIYTILTISCCYTILTDDPPAGYWLAVALAKLRVAGRFTVMFVGKPKALSFLTEEGCSAMTSMVWRPLVVAG